MATLRIRRGDSERLKAVITPYTSASGLRFIAKRRLSNLDADAIIDKSLADGIQVTVVGSSGVPAEALITIGPEDTNGLPNRIFPRVILTYSLIDGANHTLDTGELIVAPEVLTGA